MEVKSMTEFIEDYAVKADITKTEARKQVNTFLDVLADSCKTGGVSFKNFFKVAVVSKSARTGKCCGREFNTPASKKIQFTLFEGLKSIINN